LLDLTTRERERLFNNCNKFIEGQNKEKQRFAPKDGDYEQINWNQPCRKLA
jgi:hypothetical protein